jgi:hypothetical protein
VNHGEDESECEVRLVNFEMSLIVDQAQARFGESRGSRGSF